MKLLKKLFGKRRGSSDVRPSKREYPTMVDTLEGRRLFATLVINVTGSNYLFVAGGPGALFIANAPFTGPYITSPSPYSDLQINGTNSADTIYTADYSGYAVVFGNDGADTITNGSGSSTVSGGTGNDVVYGGDGIDILYGDDGADSLYGQDGDDYLIGGYGADVFGGGNGYDVLDYLARTDGGVTITVNGYGGNINDGYVAGIAAGDLVSFDIERLQGTNFSDTINGSNNNDFIVGGDGVDYIHCNGGSDIVFAGNGDDYIYAHTDPGANDQVFGEGGYDTAYLNVGDSFSTTEVVFVF